MISARLGWREIRTHRVRSVLAMIGLVIGVAAISSIGILGNSLTLPAPGTITAAGDTIVVTPNVTAAATATPNAAADIG
ncbi:MAG TPA: ABC transporter permease, partial [Methanomicrobiales archaeon]|nr:ABC transporter permease [Methanomicrobiales archaeon]